MRSDEQAIRDLISTWHRATAAGDLSLLLSMMAEDVVFLTPGNPPMVGRDGFAASFAAVTERLRIDSSSDIQEIRVSGDLAYVRNSLTVNITPLSGESPKQRKGYTLTIFRKEPAGNWLLSRDANLMAG